ncbi:MAG TPA: hypothetical protein VMU95_19370 [Trebonia sp.]|nr:hypothetical protein [Trebonia sp.]
MDPEDTPAPNPNLSDAQFGDLHARMTQTQATFDAYQPTTEMPGKVLGSVGRGAQSLAAHALLKPHKVNFDLPATASAIQSVVNPSI